MVVMLLEDFIVVLEPVFSKPFLKRIGDFWAEFEAKFVLSDLHNQIFVYHDRVLVSLLNPSAGEAVEVFNKVGPIIGQDLGVLGV